MTKQATKRSAEEMEMQVDETPLKTEPRVRFKDIQDPVSSMVSLTLSSSE